MLTDIERQAVAHAADDDAPAPTDIARFLRSLYATASPKLRLMAAGRPFIVPMDRVIPLLPARARMLDCGCGAGFLMAAAIQYRAMAEVVGYDVNSSAIAAAQRVLASLTLSGSSRATVLDLDTFTHSSLPAFDVVTIVDVLHHVPRSTRADFLRDAFSRVAPRGCVVYKDMADRPRVFALTNYLHDLLVSGERVSLTPIEEVEHLAAESGFRCETSGSERRLWYGHEWRVFRRAA